METYFNIVDIDKNNYKDIIFENICAFNVTSAGGMGDCGSIYFLYLKDEVKYYHINYVENEQELVYKVLNNFYKPFANEIKEKGAIIYGEYTDWKTYGMGMGNYLFIKNEYINEFEQIAKSYPNGLIQFEDATCSIVSRRYVNEIIYKCFKDKK